jgi:hypothetical protein
LPDRPLGSRTKKLPLPAFKPVKVMEIIGKVDVVIPHDPVNEIRPKITIISGNGGKHTFVVQPTTTMYDSEWKPTTLDKIIQGQYVNVKYRINKNGYKVALSIEPSRTGSNQPSIPQKRPGENTPRK